MKHKDDNSYCSYLLSCELKGKINSEFCEKAYFYINGSHVLLDYASVFLKYSAKVTMSNFECFAPSLFTVIDWMAKNGENVSVTLVPTLANGLMYKWSLWSSISEGIISECEIGYPDLRTCFVGAISDFIKRHAEDKYLSK